MIDWEQRHRIPSNRDRSRATLEPARAQSATSRSYTSIVIGNVFTVFNIILIAFAAVTFVFGDPEDALFLGIVVVNSGIGMVQEIRAKRALDRLAALIAPTATVIREGRRLRLAVVDIVVGDMVHVGPGDQIVADGKLQTGEAVLLDESILSGESSPLTRHAGEEVQAGAFVVEGTANFVVTAIGTDSYAGRVTATARTFRHAASPLERALNRLLFILVTVMVPLGTMLIYALWRRRTIIGEAVTVAAAAIVPLIPEGLVLLTRLTYAVATMRMARHGVLAQQLNAIESLASTEVICLDKTGTLTDPSLRLVDTVPAPGVDHGVLRVALGRYAASSPTQNSTLAAIKEALPSPPSPYGGHVPFSSRRRWSALTFGETTFLLGAPELFALGELSDDVKNAVATGRRVLALAKEAGPIVDADTGARAPRNATVLGLVILAERLRPNARASVDYLLSKGVAIKVLSGDAPETAASIAADAGIPSSSPLHGDDLPSDPAVLREVAGRTTVVGRISPEGKRYFVEALMATGRHVTMVGDGVNDVPALKAARLAIAQGSGTQMARAVADLVLVENDFAVVPPLVDEGRKILRNLQRVAKLFVTKSAFAAFVLITIGLTPESYPFLPRHLTLAAGLTIGIPSFFLALAPSGGAWLRRGLLHSVAVFAIPAGTAAGLAVVSGYLFAHNVLGLGVVEARTVSVTALILVGLYFVYVLEDLRGLRGAAVGGLCLAMLGVYAVALAWPMSRHFFELAEPSVAILFVAMGSVSFVVGGLVLSDERFIPVGFRGSTDVTRA
jgi:P-type E1-E2 ATPase